MKKLFLVLAILSGIALILFQACCRDDDDGPDYCSEEGIIIGEDDRICGCCGGWFIEIEGDTLRTSTFPDYFLQEFDPNNLPLPVYLEWSSPIGPCQGEGIIVACIRKR